MIVRISQKAESFMEIQIRSGDGRRHYTDFGKVKKVIIRPALRSNG